MLAGYFSNITAIKIIISAIDIILVWFLIYTSLKLLKGTRGIQLLKGILVIIILKVAFNIVGFKTMSYIIDQLVTWGVLAIIIIFQPEIRRTLEHLGRFDLLSSIFNKNKVDFENKESIIHILANSSRHLSRRRIGALIVLENNTGLDEYTDTGIVLNSEISKELLINVFIPGTPLHDGALILNNKKLLSASCVLPLSDNRNLDNKYGTRHRAALGLSEQTDAIVIVVSEETGRISIAMNGNLIPDFDDEKIIDFLTKNWLTNKNKIGGNI